MGEFMTENWRLVENGRYELNEQGLLRHSDTKERIYVKATDEQIQTLLDDVFPDRNKEN